MRVIKKIKHGNVIEKECGGDLPQIFFIFAIHCCKISDLHTCGLKQQQLRFLSSLVGWAQPGGFSVSCCQMKSLMCLHSTQSLVSSNMSNVASHLLGLSPRGFLHLVVQSMFFNPQLLERVEAVKSYKVWAQNQQCIFYHSLLVKASHKAIRCKGGEVNAIS